MPTRTRGRKRKTTADNSSNTNEKLKKKVAPPPRKRKKVGFVAKNKKNDAFEKAKQSIEQSDSHSESGSSDPFDVLRHVEEEDPLEIFQTEINAIYKKTLFTQDQLNICRDEFIDLEDLKMLVAGNDHLVLKEQLKFKIGSICKFMRYFEESEQKDDKSKSKGLNGGAEQKVMSDGVDKTVSCPAIGNSESAPDYKDMVRFVTDSKLEPQLLKYSVPGRIYYNSRGMIWIDFLLWMHAYETKVAEQKKENKNKKIIASRLALQHGQCCIGGTNKGVCLRRNTTENRFKSRQKH